MKAATPEAVSRRCRSGPGGLLTPGASSEAGGTGIRCRDAAAQLNHETPRGGRKSGRKIAKSAWREDQASNVGYIVGQSCIRVYRYFIRVISPHPADCRAPDWVDRRWVDSLCDFVITLDLVGTVFRPHFGGQLWGQNGRSCQCADRPAGRASRDPSRWSSLSRPVPPRPRIFL